VLGSVTLPRKSVGLSMAAAWMVGGCGEGSKPWIDVNTGLAKMMLVLTKFSAGTRSGRSMLQRLNRLSCVSLREKE
jgi:hypothetical protein